MFSHKIAELWHVIASGNIVRDWYARQFDDAAFDGVHERKISS